MQFIEAPAPACRNQRTAPAVVFKPNCAFQAPRCSVGHELRITICRIGGQVCDSCQRHVMSTFTHRCRACDYDLCRRCFASVGESFPLLANDSPLLLPDLEHQDKGFKEEVPSCGSAVCSDNFQNGGADSTSLENWDGQRPLEITSGSMCFRSSRRPQRKILHSIERRNQRLQLAYGDVGRRARRDVSRPNGQTHKLPPQILASPSRQTSDVCYFDDVAQTCVESNVSPQFANSVFSDPTDVPNAVSTFAEMGLPPNEKWRLNCAASVAVAAGTPDRANSPRGAPRSAALRQQHGRQRRSDPVELGILRPCVDDLQGCFGRARWEFE